jgi:DNA-binding transcriptional LysR family regulator
MTKGAVASTVYPIRGVDWRKRWLTFGILHPASPSTSRSAYQTRWSRTCWSDACTSQSAASPQATASWSTFTEEFRLYTAAASPLSLDALRDGDIVLVTRTNDQRTQNLAKRLQIKRHAVAFGLEAVATMLVGGRVVGFLPTHDAEMLAPIHYLQEVSGAEAFRYTTQFSLISAIDRPLPPSGRLLAKLLTQAAKPD